MVTKVVITRYTALCGICPDKYIRPKIFSKYSTTSKATAARLTRPLLTVGKIRLKTSTILVAFTVESTTGLYGLTAANCIKKRKKTNKIATLIKTPKISAELAPILVLSYLNRFSLVTQLLCELLATLLSCCKRCLNIL